MNYIVITDIFGNKINNNEIINNNLPFIIIHGNPKLLLSHKIDGIWKIILPSLHQILNSNNFNPQLFHTVGDIWLNAQELPNKIMILLANSNKLISAYPIDYVKIDTYVDTNIWKPITPPGFQEIGLIASSIKPSITDIKVINSKYLIEYDGELITKGRNTNMNEFNLLSNIESKKFTINKIKFLNKLSEKNTICPSNINTMKKNESYKNHAISHNIQGELKINEPFCKYSKKNTNDLESEELNTIDSINSWKICAGKILSLIEPDDPWYINKKNQANIKHKELSDDYHKSYKNTTYDTNNTNNTHSENLTYSFDTEKCNKIDFNAIACSLLLLILLLVMIRYCINKK